MGGGHGRDEDLDPVPGLEAAGEADDGAGVGETEETPEGRSVPGPPLRVARPGVRAIGDDGGLCCAAADGPLGQRPRDGRNPCARQGGAFGGVRFVHQPEADVGAPFVGHRGIDLDEPREAPRRRHPCAIAGEEAQPLVDPVRGSASRASPTVAKNRRADSMRSRSPSGPERTDPASMGTTRTASDPTDTRGPTTFGA